MENIWTKGTKKFVDKIFLAWKDERKLRIDYEKRKLTKALNYKVYEFNKEGNENLIKYAQKQMFYYMKFLLMESLRRQPK